MQSPFTGGEVRLNSITETVTFRGEQFTITTQAYLCVETNEEFTTTTQDDEMMAQVRRLWCERHQVPTAEQLRARRTTLGLSTIEVSALLGFGINEYRQYENGAKVPSKSNARALRLFVKASPTTLADLVEAACEDLKPKTLQKLHSALQEAAHQREVLAHASVYGYTNLEISSEGVLHRKRVRTYKYSTPEAAPAVLSASLPAYGEPVAKSLDFVSTVPSRFAELLPS